MKTFFDNLPFESGDFLVRKFFSESALFVDIETTGFSAKHTRVYLIGCAGRTGNVMNTYQYFSESDEEEETIIRTFLDLLAGYDTLITFNGLGFDIPYLKERCRALEIPEQLDACSHLDLFRTLTPYRKILKLPNLKQKSLEAFLELNREDIYNGGELINLYQEYLNEHDLERLHFIQLHNFEDVTGMFHLLPLLSYVSLFQGCFQLSGAKQNAYEEYEGSKALELIFTLELEFSLPKRFSCGKGCCYLSGFDRKAKLKVTVYQGELKYFYSNYRDYYYLPQEDRAIHKSVAFYVDKDFRTKAKAATCYSKRTGRFLPQFAELFLPYFKLEYHDKASYFEMTEEFTGSPEAQKRYVIHLLQYMLSSKD